MSLRIVPNTANKHASVQDTKGSLGLHDTFEYGPRSLATEISSHDGLQGRLESWEETQDDLKLNLQRNIYGMHAPMRQLMERSIVSRNFHMPALPQSNLHLDILMGRDELIEPADIFSGVEPGPTLSIHKEMEKKLKL